MTDRGFDVFDVHHQVGRAFDALGGEPDDGSEESAQIVESEPSDVEKDAILGGNARRLLRVPADALHTEAPT